MGGSGSRRYHQKPGQRARGGAGGRQRSGTHCTARQSAGGSCSPIPVAPRDYYVQAGRSAAVARPWGGNGPPTCACGGSGGAHHAQRREGEPRQALLLVCHTRGARISWPAWRRRVQAPHSPPWPACAAQGRKGGARRTRTPSCCASFLSRSAFGKAPRARARAGAPPPDGASTCFPCEPARQQNLARPRTCFPLACWPLGLPLRRCLVSRTHGS